MSLWDGFRVGLAAIVTNRLRSFLTMLGIIIGVASVITIVAVGAGAQIQIAEQIRALGTNLLSVYAAEDSGEGNSGDRVGQVLVEADVNAILEQIPQVVAASPFVWRTARVIRGNTNAWTVLQGTTADYFMIREWPLAVGRIFFPEEEARAAKVAILGAHIARTLFGNTDPIGAEMRILNVQFQIIGVLTERGAVTGDRNQDLSVFIPFSTLKLRLSQSDAGVRRDTVDYILVKAASEDAILVAQHEIDALLRQRHQLIPGQKAGFDIGNPAAELAARENIANTFAWLLASVASVSLIVGGISIMNIMLVSVTERTHEIGLRMALGARRRDIRRQFLMEAITLCLVGGLIGLAIGVGASVALASAAEWPVFIGINAVLLAVGFAAAVGITFGWYPASKAARLKPIEALRSV